MQNWFVKLQKKQGFRQVSASEPEDALRLAYLEYKWTFCIRSVFYGGQVFTYSGSCGWATVREA